MQSVIKVAFLLIAIIAYEVFATNEFQNEVEIIFQVAIGVLIVVVVTSFFGIPFCIIKNRVRRFLTTFAISLAVSFVLCYLILVVLFGDGAQVFLYVFPAMGIICLVVTVGLEWDTK